MSAIKTLLPDDFDGDEDFMRVPDYDADNVMDGIKPADYHYLMLYNSLTSLAVIKPLEYLDELKYCRHLLDTIIEETEKPF